ncbi:uncharacterized protein METZ01_LOCUS405990, partial [marine metagenome]
MTDRDDFQNVRLQRLVDQSQNE